MKHVKESGISLSYTAILNAFADQTSFSTLPFLDTLLCANARAQSVAALTEAGALSSESLSPSLNRDFDFADAKNFSFYYTEKGVLKKQLGPLDLEFVAKFYTHHPSKSYVYALKNQHTYKSELFYRSHASRIVYVKPTAPRPHLSPRTAYDAVLNLEETKKALRYCSSARDPIQQPPPPFVALQVYRDGVDEEVNQFLHLIEHQEL